MAEIMETVKEARKGYKLVQETLRERIVRGEWPVGFKVPSEKELGHQFRLNRLTINKSLVNLAAEGLIIRKRGQGTFVADPISRSARLRHLVKFISPVSDENKVPVRHGILEAMHEVLSGNGYHVGVDFYRNRGSQLEQIHKDRDDYHAGFVVWFEPDKALKLELARLRERGYPFVLVDGFFPDLETDYVITDSREGARSVVRHLAERGHRVISYMTRTVDRPSLRDRQAGFLDGLVSCDLPVWEHSVVKLEAAGPAAVGQVAGVVDRLLAGSPRPTAVFFGNDDLALAAMDHLQGRNVRVPEDVAVVGYDNCDRSAFGPVPLTTVAQDWFQMGKVAAEVLLERLTGMNGARPVQVSLKPELIVRESA